MLGRYSFTVFFFVLILGVAYWSDQIERHRAHSSEIAELSVPSPARKPRELVSTSDASKSIRAPASENRPLEIEAIGD